MSGTQQSCAMWSWVRFLPLWSSLSSPQLTVLYQNNSNIAAYLVRANHESVCVRLDFGKLDWLKKFRAPGRFRLQLSRYPHRTDHRRICFLAYDFLSSVRLESKIAFDPRYHSTCDYHVVLIFKQFILLQVITVCEVFKFGKNHLLLYVIKSWILNKTNIY